MFQGAADHVLAPLWKSLIISGLVFCGGKVLNMKCSLLWGGAGSPFLLKQEGQSGL